MLEKEITNFTPKAVSVRFIRNNTKSQKMLKNCAF